MYDRNKVVSAYGAINYKRNFFKINSDKFQQKFEIAFNFTYEIVLKMNRSKIRNRHRFYKKIP